VPYLGPGEGGELDGAAHIVLMPVGLEDVPYAEVLPGRLFRVHDAIPSRVDDRSRAAMAYKIGMMGETLRFDALEQHTETI